VDESFDRRSYNAVTVWMVTCLHVYIFTSSKIESGDIGRGGYVLEKRTGKEKRRRKEEAECLGEVKIKGSWNIYQIIASWWWWWWCFREIFFAQL